MKIIAFEGIDGSGKTVQSLMLHQYLIGKGKHVLYFEFPRYTANFAGRKIDQYLKNKTDRPDSESMALWYALDRLETVNIVKNYWNECDYVIFNRWTLSSYVYQANPFWVQNLEYNLFDLPAPDFYLIFDIDPKIAAKRKLIQRGELDVYEKDTALQFNAAKKYRTLLQKYKSLYIPHEIIATTLAASVNHTIEFSEDDIFCVVKDTLRLHEILPYD